MYYSFLQTINEGIKQNIDFVLICGDLFHHKNVTAQTLSNAEKGLTLFAEKKIPTILIQGNHDAKLYREDMTWLEYLHRKQKSILLQADITETGLSFQQYNKKQLGSHAGFVDIGNGRIFGLQYSGQRTIERLQQVKTAIQQVNDEYGTPDWTILLGHFGVEGHIPGLTGGVPMDEIKNLSTLVDYLALGHLHKQYSEKNWVFNPGSLEAHDTRESTWDLGYYLTEISKGKTVKATHVLSKRRPFHKIVFSVGRFQSKEALMHGFKRKLGVEQEYLEKLQQQQHFQKENKKRQPIIDLRLRGQLQFSRSRLDLEELILLIEDKTNAIKVQPSDATESIETGEIINEIQGGRAAIFDEDGHLNRSRLEQAVFSLKAGEDARYCREKEQIASVLIALKKELLAREPPEDIAETLQKKRHQLFPIDTQSSEEKQ
jgi:DNA repair exonuclease SbcCD nuclease subunit